MYLNMQNNNIQGKIIYDPMQNNWPCNIYVYLHYMDIRVNEGCKNAHNMFPYVLKWRLIHGLEVHSPATRIM